MTGQELKNAILQQAVQGKLVPQDPNDLPASELLKQIRAEKQHLIAAGKIKKEKALPPITPEEIPFEIPESWEWVRLGDVGAWGSGATPNKSNLKFYDGGTIPWLLTGDLNDSIIKNIPNKITEFALKETSVKLNPKNSVLMAMYGATIGKLGILSFPATTNQACCACRVFKGIEKFYLFYYLMSQRTAFQKRGEGGAQPNISKEKIVITLIPLPPLAEQKRIVERIEELLPLAEEYGEEEEALNQAESRFPEAVKKSILQEAVQGKLVPQDPNDLPASELLKQIRAEKQHLIAAGKIKKEKPLPPITPEEIPFEIPESWEWVKFNDICQRIHYGYTASAQKNGNAKLLRITDIQNNFVNWNQVPTCSIPDDVLQNYQLSNGDIVIARTGGTVGKTYIITDLHQNAVFASYLIRAVPLLNINKKYLKMALETPLFWSQLKVFTKGAAQPNVSGESLKNFIFPLPPLAEQKRIVKKIEELLPLCSRLQ